MKQITVLLADDHTIMREGLRALLELEPDMQVVGEARHGREAVELAKKLRPDVVVMDIAMPQLNGVGATQQMLEALPGTKVLILSAYSDDPYVHRVLAVGAVGFLVKQSSSQGLSKAIRAVVRGNIFLSPSLSRRVQEQHRPGGPPVGAKIGGVLTAREMEVVQLIAEGSSNKETGVALGISVKTVEKHRQHLMDKLGIHDTAGLTRYAIAHGIIESPLQVTII